MSVSHRIVAVFATKYHFLSDVIYLKTIGSSTFANLNLGDLIQKMLCCMIFTYYLDEAIK